MSQALYYPWIDVPDEAWLKTALLYWDSVRTIVPKSIVAPYSTGTGRALYEEEFLVPLRVDSDMEEIQGLAVDVQRYLESAEGAELLIAGHADPRDDIHVEKLQPELRWLADVNSEKLPYKIHNRLRELTANSERGDDWFRVNESFTNYYMTLLASRLAERVGAQLLTSLAAADRLAVSARFDAELNGVIPWRSHSREYDAFGRRRRMPRQLAPGMLANLAIERIAVAPDTPIDRLIKFREKHRDELALFRTKVEKIASSIESDLTAEALRQHVSDLYTNEVVPAIANLKASLEGRKIKWFADGLLKIGFLSAGSSSMLVVAGLEVPMALLAGAGISLIATGAMYNVDKKESLQSNPFSYLLSVERKLAVSNDK